MKTPSEMIAEAGELLYGSQWQSDLAVGLEVNRRTVQRWRAGDAEPQAGIWTDLVALVDDRISALRRLRATLVTQAKTKPQPGNNDA